jgi:hypothetical protein
MVSRTQRRFQRFSLGGLFSAALRVSSLRGLAMVPPPLNTTATAGENRLVRNPLCRKAFNATALLGLEPGYCWLGRCDKPNTFDKIVEKAIQRKVPTLASANADKKILLLQREHISMSDTEGSLAKAQGRKETQEAHLKSKDCQRCHFAERLPCDRNRSHAKTPRT